MYVCMPSTPRYMYMYTSVNQESTDITAPTYVVTQMNKHIVFLPRVFPDTSHSTHRAHNHARTHVIKHPHRNRVIVTHDLYTRPSL